MLWGQDAYWFPKYRALWIEQLGMWCLRLLEPPSIAPLMEDSCALCPVTAARAEILLCHVRCLLSGDLYTTSEGGPGLPSPQHSAEHHLLPRLKTVFLDKGLGLGQNIKEASYTLPARKWLILSVTYIAEVNQWNVLHRLRKSASFCSPANNNQILWGNKMSPL